MVALLLKHSFMENFEQHYKSEATEDWVCSGMISFKMPAVGRERNPPNSISLLSVFVFPTVNVFLQGDRAGSWWKPFIFLDEAGQEMEEPSGWKGPRTIFSGWSDHPPTECDFEGSQTKISAMGPEFLATALGAMQSLSPCIYPHTSLFLTVTRLNIFSPHGGGRFSIGFSQISPSSPGHRWCLQCPMSGLFLPNQKDKSTIHYDVDENLWPNPQDRVDKNIEVQWGTQLTSLQQGNWVLQLVFHSSKEGWAVASHFRSSSSGRLRQAAQVQNVNFETNRAADQIRGLFFHHESQGRILPHIHPSVSQEVPEVRFWGQSIPILGSSVRLSIITPHFHEMRRCSPGASSPSGYSHYELHRWLVDSSSVASVGSAASRCRSGPHERVRVTAKCQKECAF